MQESFRAVCETLHVRKANMPVLRRNCNDRSGVKTGGYRTAIFTSASPQSTGMNIAALAEEQHAGSSRSGRTHTRW
jgi:hypothetical protein